MSGIDRIKERLPDYARDLRINLGILTTSSLTPDQVWGVAIASAATARNAELLAAIVEDATPVVSADVIAAARGAASIMGMNNVYYRFLHYTGDAYSQLPARLRMQIIGKPGISHADFELMCLAASAITGCESCVKAHDKVVRDKGLSAENVQDAVRIAAVLHATAIALEAQT